MSAPDSSPPVEVFNYPEYQQYQDTVYSPVQYPELDNHLHDPYQRYEDPQAEEYEETEALQYQDDRYQTNYADSPTIQSRSDTDILQTSRLERLWNRISQMMKNFVQTLEERSRSGDTDRLWTIYVVGSILVGSILAL